MKKYKLLKDLPDLKAGAIFENHCKDCGYDHGNHSYYIEVVENNSEWFEEVKEDEGFNALAHMLAMNIEELHKIKDSLMNIEDFYE